MVQLTATFSISSLINVSTSVIGVQEERFLKWKKFQKCAFNTNLLNLATCYWTLLVEEMLVVGVSSERDIAAFGLFPKWIRLVDSN